SPSHRSVSPSVPRPVDKVVLGEFSLDSDEEDVQVLRVAEKFTPRGACVIPIHNDIALLKLATPARLSDTVSPLRLAGHCDHFPPGTPCVITGWGRTQGNHTENSPTLRQAVLPLVSKADCKTYWGDDVTGEMICAGGSGTAPCINDSGGPLVCQKGGVWTQVGIVSWGSRECETDKPAVFTRVPAFECWIKETMGAN
ncbi:chymotrypsinogen B-like, partial [Perognathus longimembris pacificus]|uniref:chymotrypsinogen B-like n=1 Tax=Perognathus longimembris pacificus TaxID=214514 RepID=UPI002019FD46